MLCTSPQSQSFCVLLLCAVTLRLDTWPAISHEHENAFQNGAKSHGGLTLTHETIALFSCWLYAGAASSPCPFLCLIPLLQPSFTMYFPDSRIACEHLGLHNVTGLQARDVSRKNTVSWLCPVDHDAAQGAPACNTGLLHNSRKA